MTRTEFTANDWAGVRVRKYSKAEGGIMLKTFPVLFIRREWALCQPQFA